MSEGGQKHCLSGCVFERTCPPKRRQMENKVMLVAVLKDTGLVTFSKRTQTRPQRGTRPQRADCSQPAVILLN